MIKNTIDDSGKTFKIKLVPDIKDLNVGTIELNILFDKNSKIPSKKYFTQILNDSGEVETFMYSSTLFKCISAAMNGCYVNSKGQFLSKESIDSYWGDENGNFVYTSYSEGLKEFFDVHLLDRFNPYDLKCSKYLTYDVESIDVPGINRTLMNIKNIGWSDGDVIFNGENKEEVMLKYTNTKSLKESVDEYKLKLFMSNNEVLFDSDAMKQLNKNRITNTHT